MNATATNPRTGKVEPCQIWTGYHGWQDGVSFPSDPAPLDPGSVYGRNELPDLKED